MKHFEVEKSKSFTIAEEVVYASGSIVIKTIIRKVTGSISALAFDAGEVLKGALSPFDNFIQVVEGTAEILIDDKSNLLETGQSIIIPAHSNNAIKGSGRFKIVSTIIKSGYEELV